MKELKCPQCGTMFTIDEADYASIVDQVKNKEFERELQRRMEEFGARLKAEQDAERARVEKNIERNLSAKMQELSEKDTEIIRLREQISSAVKSRELEMRDEISAREREIAELKASLAQVDNTVRIAVLEEQGKALEQIRDRETEIANLRNEVKNSRNDALIRENSLREQHKLELRQAEEQIAFYRDLKTKMSTKMVGETLEEHCSTTFEMSLRPHMPSAQFGKDTVAVDGTKGDFIYRNFDDGVEYISIMFEMKNEMEGTEKKHRNEDFFKKLDEDRCKKGCEYAVLVSTLESESELYNSGIVDVSHRYEKMYVVRPQFFVPIITLLDQAARKSIEYKRELIIAREQSIDITNFETKLSDFKLDINGNVERAHKNFEAAIKQIDKAIKDLQDTKDSLMKSGNNLRIANEKAMDLTIRSLTYRNPTMKRMFNELHENEN